MDTALAAALAARLARLGADALALLPPSPETDGRWIAQPTVDGDPTGAYDAGATPEEAIAAAARRA